MLQNANLHLVQFLPKILAVLFVMTSSLFLAACTQMNSDAGIASISTEIAARAVVAETSQATDQATPPGSVAITLSTTPFGYPTKAPMTILIEGDELVFSNNTEAPILVEAFPQELLAVIEWGPCSDQRNCPELVVLPGQTKKTKLNRIVSPNTDIITVFWWNISEQDGGKGYFAGEVHSHDLSLH